MCCLNRNVHDMHVVGLNRLIANTPTGTNGVIVTSAMEPWPFIDLWIDELRSRRLRYFRKMVVFPKEIE